VLESLGLGASVVKIAVFQAAARRYIVAHANHREK
jgi:hypothetical protein